MPGTAGGAASVASASRQWMAFGKRRRAGAAGDDGELDGRRLGKRIGGDRHELVLRDERRPRRNC